MKALTLVELVVYVHIIVGLSGIPDSCPNQN